MNEKKKWGMWLRSKWGIVGMGVVVGLTVVMSSYGLKYQGRIYPGVKVGGVEVGGLDREAATKKLDEYFASLEKLVLVWGTNRWEVEFEDMGLEYDTQAVVERALEVGRGGVVAENIREQYKAANRGWKIEPVFWWEENKLVGAIASVAAEINIPAQEPEVSWNKTEGEVVVMAGENGQQVDERELVQRIRQRLVEADGEEIEIPVLALQPKLDDGQLEQARLRAEKLIANGGKRLEVVFEEGGDSWEVVAEQLITWIDPAGAAWKDDSIEEWVAQLAETVDRPAQNASFQYISPGRVTEFKPAKAGWKVQRDAMSRKIGEAVKQLELGEQTQEIQVGLLIEKEEPHIANSEVNNLGIVELLGKGESWFSGSITNRIFNLKKATEALNGILVAPGEVFSFNGVIGEISANTGYKQAYIIKEGKTILGDGGGVCQTSTTMFRAVLAAGLPIEERVAHAYRVSYYEEKYQPGFDATVFQPSPDFKFRNDTPAYILIQTHYDEVAKKLTYEIYGTSDGRKAEISKARVWEVTAPPPDLYQDDPTLAAGTVRQVEHAAWGAKVAFDWKVTRGDEVLQQRTFYSNYTPWQAVYLRGTKI